MGSATYRFVTSDGETGYSNFATKEEAALQAQADLASGRVIAVDIFDTSALPDVGPRETPPTTDVVAYDENSLPPEADLIIILGG
jgi:hypothetical protein